MNDDVQKMIISIQLAQETGIVLQEYIKIQNHIFASPWKKFLKAFFKDSVPYEQLVDGLAAQQLELYEIGSQIDDPSMLGETLKRYVDALTDTVITLKDLCTGLNKKNQGDNSYTLKDYQQDYATYQNCVHTYRAIGGQLNEHIKSIQQSVDPTVKTPDESGNIYAHSGSR